MGETTALKNKLASNNLKATSLRLAFLDLLTDHTGAVSFSKIQQSFDNVNRTTLYRTIQTFLDKGLIHVASNQNDTYYALCDHQCSSKSHQHNHVHFECVKCNAISCEELVNQLKINLPQFKIETTEILLTGTCKHCI